MLCIAQWQGNIPGSSSAISSSRCPPGCTRYMSQFPKFSSIVVDREVPFKEFKISSLVDFL